MNTERRQNQLEDFDRLEKKLDVVEADVKELTKKLFEDHSSHHEYIKKAMEREARREALHRAIIEKTLLALIWGGILGGGKLVWDVVSTHWK